MSYPIDNLPYFWYSIDMKDKKAKKSGTEQIRKGWEINPRTRIAESKKRYKRSKFVEKE